MTDTFNLDGRKFEEEVRHTARWVWNLPPGEGCSQFIANFEIDCVCRTQDVIHLIECTVSRMLKKVREDTDSLKAAKASLEKQGHTVKAWIVTFNEPTPDQRTHAHAQRVTILSIQQLRDRIFKASDYLNSRWSYRFGSAADPTTGDPRLPDDEYVPLPLSDSDSGKNYTVEDLISVLTEKKLNVILTGPFGAGKSLTVREVFKRLRAGYFKSEEQIVPVVLNLRDHWGQDDTDEVLRRHAARVGFQGRDDLVRAWNAGLLLPILDGFDELASQAWRVAPLGLTNMKRVRYEAVKIIRAFQKENKGRYGILITGRDHYFDSPDEMNRALGVDKDTTSIHIGEFAEDQANKYLAKKGVRQRIPDWIPRKPLLLGYLASRDLLKDVLQIDGSAGIAKAWDVFLTKICDREAGVSSDIDGQSVRRLLEVLATEARTGIDGAGPLFESSLSAAYLRVTGSEPLEEARMLLQRLPALTARDQQEGGRSFVDLDMLDALRGGAVARYITDPYSNPGPDGRLWRHSLGEIGYSLTAALAQEWKTSPTVHLTGAKEALNRWESPVLAMDCILSGAHRSDVDILDCMGLVIKEGQAKVVDLDHCALCNLELQWCHIETLYVGESQVQNIRLYQCMVDRIIGISDEKGLPTWVEECEISEYDALHTNAAIMRSSVPIPVRVLLTVLRKLFVQKGRARKETALYRGLEQNALVYVPQVLDIVRKSGIAEKISLADGAIWHPHRNCQARVQQIIATLGAGEDPIVKQAWSME